MHFLLIMAVVIHQMMENSDITNIKADVLCSASFKET